MAAAGALRYTPQRAATPALVPREACETPTLRQKLKGFALKPLIRGTSQKRSEKVRQEIEQRQYINVAAGLWSDTNFAFVAEAKAKTIQLRHRTMAMLQKIDLCERTPTPPKKPEEALPGTSVEADSGQQQSQSRKSGLQPMANQAANCELPAAALQSSNPECPPSGDSSPHTSKIRSIKKGIRERVASVMLEETQKDDLLDLLCKDKSKPLGAQDKKRMLEAVLSEKHHVSDKMDAEKTNKLLLPPSTDAKRRSSAPSVPIAPILSQTSSVDSVVSGDQNSNDSKDIDKSDGKAPGPPEKLKDATVYHSSPSKRTPSKEQNMSTPTLSKQNSAKALSAREVAHMSPATPNGKRRLSRLNNVRQSVQQQSKKKLKNPKGAPRHHPITLQENQELLYEMKREVKTLDESFTFPAAHIWIITDSSIAGGGIRIEVNFPMSSPKCPHPKVKGRDLTQTDVQRLFETGGVHEQHAQERYQWLCGIVCLESEYTITCRCGESFPPFLNVCQTCGAKVEAPAESKIVLDGFDQNNFFTACMKRRSAEPVKQELIQAFECNTQRYKRRSDLEEQLKGQRKSLTDSFQQREIAACCQRFKMYESAAEALYDLFLKFDFNGDGKMNEEEFTRLLRGVNAAIGKPPQDPQQIKRTWRELKSYSEKLVFTQFVNFLISKFPRVQQMTAFEISRFSTKAREFSMEDGEKTAEW